MNDSTDAKTAFAPIWKRKWLIMIVGLLVGVGTYVYYHHEPSVYGSSTELYLGGNAEVQALLGDGQGSATERERTLANQVALINSSLIGEQVIHQLIREGNLTAARGVARASAAEGSDFIFIVTEAGSARAAADLANAYAGAFQETQKAKDRRNLLAALASTRQQLAHAEAQETTSTAQTVQVQELLGQISQLRVQLTLNNAGIQQIGSAGVSSVPQSPKPTRNAIFGLVLGLVLAAFAAYGLSRFDRRLRSLADVGRVFDSPLLAAIPSIRNPIGAGGLPQPAGALREPLRRLHATLQLQGTSEDLRGWLAPRSILFISPDSGDGKSTLAAGLALVESEAGAQAAIVEANLRRPVLGQLLGLNGTRGLAEVLGVGDHARGHPDRPGCPGRGGDPRRRQPGGAGHGDAAAPGGIGGSARRRRPGREPAGPAVWQGDVGGPAVGDGGLRLRPRRRPVPARGRRRAAADVGGGRDRHRRPSRPYPRGLCPAAGRPARTGAARSGRRNRRQ